MLVISRQSAHFTRIKRMRHARQEETINFVEVNLSFFAGLFNKILGIVEHGTYVREVYS